MDRSGAFGDHEDPAEGPAEREARAREAMARALEWLGKARAPGADRPGADPDVRDRLIGELTTLEGELTTAGVPGDDPDLAVLRARLGGLYAQRYLTAPTRDDRTAGLRALRAARATGLTDEHNEERRSALQLLLLLMPPGLVDTGDHRLPRLQEAFELVRLLAVGDPELTADMRELRTLMDRFRGETTPETARYFHHMDRALTVAEGSMLHFDLGELRDLATEMTSGDADNPQTGLLNAALSLLGSTPRPGAGSDEPPVPPVLPEPPTAEEAAAFYPLAAAGLEMLAPGTLRPDEMEGLLTRLGDAPSDGSDTLMAILGRMSQGLRTGDPAALAEGVDLLNGATPDTTDGGLLSEVSRLVSPGLLTAATTSGGSLADRDRLRGLLDTLLGPDPAAARPSAPSRSVADLLLISRVLHCELRMAEAAEAGDVDGLETILDELLDLQEETGDSSEFSFITLYMLGLLHMYLARFDGGVSAIRTACSYLDEAVEMPVTLPMLHPLLDSARLASLALASLADPDPVRLTAAIARTRRSLDSPEMAASQHPRTRHLIALCLQILRAGDGDPALLDEEIAELEQAREELADGGVAEVAQQVLWALAEAYRRRGDTARGDGPAAVAAARDSLRILAEDVLLQLGPEHGLKVARSAASRGLLAASWAAEAHRREPAVALESAVAALEAGRALVLRSAAASAGVAEQLHARGESELAERWHEARPLLRPSAPPEPPAEAERGALETAERMLSSGWSGGLTIPSTLRRRALAVLRRPHDGAEPGTEPLRELLDGPGVTELRDGLRACHADALVYLVPGQGGADGTAVVVRPDADPAVCRLPGLGALGRAPLDHYLDAGARRSAVQEKGTREAQEAAYGHWESALDAVSRWAGGSVLGPVLDTLPPVPDGAPARRITLVPCGNLGAVPWHAAHLPDGGGYLCRSTVLTYAASGDEFLRSVRRARAPLAERPVLVADPSDELQWAQDEISALRNGRYPGARVLGSHDDLDTVAAGTPDDILGCLDGTAAEPPATLLHLAVHGVAAPSPTDSLLHCDPGDGPGDDPGCESGGGSGGTGQLTVSRILDPAGHPRHSRPAAGALVVLSACETDLSSRDHDEALTPTTALLARGAADVVGSRWKVPDSAASAALMVVLHHRLAVEGLAPPDALRAAQLWMLDLDREPVPGLDGELLAAVERDPAGPTALSSWAAFIHQGNPAPAPRDRAPAR
ncbi:CHAT domain-containing protein [Streptomyces sp. NPDC000594]|uniref:CHAT domain-containing protein n=1 Tax=Streptomyces sp. NPDC000594 TaxID=3154261 RepID=UPI00332777D3